MTIVADHWVDPIGGPIPQGIVTAHLRTDSINTNAPGFDSVGLRAVIPEVSDMTDDLGAWSLDLIPNTNFDALAPGSYYEITFKLGRLTVATFPIEVPAAGGPYRLDEIPAGSTTATLMPPALHMTPRLYVGTTAGGYTEVNYGADPGLGPDRGLWSSATAYAIGDVVTYGSDRYIATAAGTNHQPDTNVPTWWNQGQVRDCKYELTPTTCKATYMFRMGTGFTTAPSGKYFAIELPVPAAMDVGNGVAEAIGTCLVGINPLTHKFCSANLGRVGDGTNPNFFYLVPSDDVALSNSSFGKAVTDWVNFHPRIEYWRA